MVLLILFICRWVANTEERYMDVKIAEEVFCGCVKA